MINFVKNILGTCSLLLVMASHTSGLAQTNLSNSNRMESEYKLAVPKGQEDALWEHLATTYSTEQLRKLGLNLSSRTETESFIDLYFDTPDDRLLNLNAGVRLRQRFLGDSLMKKLVQLKLPGGDSVGVVRREIKFDVYDNIKHNDRQAMHPFYRYIRPGDRDEVNRFLAQLNLQAQDLRPALKMKQVRSRVYISENGEALMTLTLDRASSAYFPYPGFTELEMELNEIRYTEGDSLERRRMEQLNASLKEQLLTAFPALRQDQTPKYNKMHDKVSRNLLAKVTDKIPYLSLAVLALFALVLFLKTEVLGKRRVLQKMGSNT